ncbi:outer membrane beta-barrel protein [bacterium]|nr:outer membrane beta-barrel protein [bacterium]
MKKVLVVLFMVMLSTVAFSQTEIGLNGVGAHISLVMPDNVDNTIGFGAHADLGTIFMEELSLHAYVDYWGMKEDIGLGEIKFSNISLAAIAKYNFDMDQAFTPYAGGGMGLDFAKSKWETDIDIPGVKNGGESDTETELVIHILGGAKMPINDQITGFAEAKYSIGGFDAFMLTVGASFNLQ